GRQAGARAYSLGPGDRAGPAGRARSEKPAHGRTRDRREAARRNATLEYADETLERKRAEGLMPPAPRATRRYVRSCATCEPNWRPRGPVARSRPRAPTARR